MTKKFSLVTPIFYGLAILVGILPWISYYRHKGADPVITQQQALRPATLIFTPNNLQVAATTSSSVTLSLDTDGALVQMAHLVLVTLSGNIIVSQIIPVQSGCQVSLNPVELQCKIPQNTSTVQLLPLATLSVSGGGILGVDPSSTVTSSNLSGVNRLAYFPNLIISNQL